MMDAWSDRATGDPAANRALRNRIMAPIEIPAAGSAVIALVVLAVSRLLLTSTQLGAVVIAGVLAVVILGIGVLAAADIKVSKNITAGLALVLAIAILGGGVWATVVGEREFEEHEVHAEDGAEDDAEHTDGDNDGE